MLEASKHKEDIFLIYYFNKLYNLQFFNQFICVFDLHILIILIVLFCFKYKFSFLYRLLVTGGEDETIFIFTTESTENYPTLIPIGFIQLQSYPTVLTWKPEHASFDHFNKQYKIAKIVY